MQTTTRLKVPSRKINQAPANTPNGRVLDNQQLQRRRQSATTRTTTTTTRKYLRRRQTSRMSTINSNKATTTTLHRLLQMDPTAALSRATPALLMSRRTSMPSQTLRMFRPTQEIRTAPSTTTKFQDPKSTTRLRIHLAASCRRATAVTSSKRMLWSWRRRPRTKRSWIRHHRNGPATPALSSTRSRSRTARCATATS